MTSQQYILVGAILAIVIAGVLLLLVVIRRRHARTRVMQQLTRKIGFDAIADFIVSDGNEGEIYIDHLVLTPRGLMLLDSIDTAGTVFAGDRMNIWSATHNGTRVNFDNPIPALADRVNAIKAIVPGVPIESYVLFIGEVEFPKGHPDKVTTVAKLLNTVAHEPSHDETSVYQGQWAAIKASALTTP